MNYLSTNRLHMLGAFLLVLALLRLSLLGAFPLMDTTEARYGEIARIMVETDNWLTPQYDYNVPFWGKPPLFAWVSAVSSKLFGNSEFAMRFPHWIAALLVLFSIFHFARKLEFDSYQALTSIAVLSTTTGFLFAAGVVMTDMLLCLSTALVMIGFWLGWHGEQRYIYLMYAGLGLGLLAKGPVIIVLAILVIFPWLVVQFGLLKMWPLIWQRLRIVSGTLLLLFIAAPWYLLAENATPGFLHYFFIGEHFERFVVSGWQGDLYGSGHAVSRGVIWVYWLLFTLPWSPILIYSGYRAVRKKKDLFKQKGLSLFLLLWMCSPLFLFTFAANILPAYILPGLPAVGILMLGIYNRAHIRKENLLYLFAPFFLLVLAGSTIFYFGDFKSQKSLLTGVNESGYPIYYLKHLPYSARFYSNGRARLADGFPDEATFYLATGRNYLSASAADNCRLHSSNKNRKLLFCNRN